MPANVPVVPTMTASEPVMEELGHGVLRIPAAFAQSVEVRFAPLAERDRFDPLRWRRVELKHLFDQPGYYEIDLDELSLEDGAYEYEFLLVDGNGTVVVVQDPYAEELTRFGGYRGVFHIRNGRRWRRPFRWEDELPDGMRLPRNNEIVIYEMPLRWMAGAAEQVRQVGLGTVDRVLFDRLDQLHSLGVNVIELLPIQDSADTLNWGYGTRFFFVPDLDMGTPVDLKFLVKQCHRRGIRVLLDVVMNHARQCPLENLASDWFFLRNRDEEPGRGEDWGGRLFRYRRTAPDGRFVAREFHYRMAEFWVREYHVDGFRIDEFRGIDHWEFIQTFRDRATAAHQALFPDRPFLVVAEDSWRRAGIAQDRPENPNDRRIVDSIWNFAYRDEMRRLLTDSIRTEWGQPSRRERIEAAVSGRSMWDDWNRRFELGFGDLAEAVNYLTSHDVQAYGEQRFMNFVFGDVLRQRGLGDGSMANVRWLVDHISQQSPAIQAAHADALDRVRSAFVLLLTSVGIPMFLAGEEFGDVHDLEHGDPSLKMSDPVDWTRRDAPGHRALWDAVQELTQLRRSHATLQRNEIDFFYFHPTIDANDGIRVFAYCRTGGQPRGRPGQVVVIANCGPHDFPVFQIPWPWNDSTRVREHATPSRGTRPRFRPSEDQAELSLAPFQTRVFTT